MKRNLLRLPVLASALALALSACSSGSGGSTVPNPLPTTNVAPGTSGAGILARIAGVGDSLTAGFQSNALIGVGAANPLYPSQSKLPFIQSTQDKGFWAQLWGAANNQAATSAPLPLIQFPGLGSVLIPTIAPGFTSVQTTCGGLNNSGLTGAGLTTRVSTSSLPLDLGIPGQLFHEALYQVAAITPCPSLLPGATLQGLGALIVGESANVSPILGQFNGLSQVQAAVSLRPTLTTVWLGSNDLLKYIFSGAQFGPTPAASIQADAQLTIATLQAAGSQVAIANLPDVLLAPIFTPIQNLSAFLQSQGAPPTLAAQASAGIAQTYGLAPGGYVTLQGITKIAAALPTGQLPTLGVGDFLTPAFASQVQSLNDSYNAAIAAAAQAQPNVAFVDIRATIRTAATSGAPINPPKCCTAQFLGGLFSYDGIHPSNTGYALIANTFIASINAKFGTSIPAVNVVGVYATDPYAPH